MYFHGIIIALLLLLTGQFTLPTRGGIASGTATCTPPTMTYRWPVYGAGNTCNGGLACSNGLGIDTLVDVVGTNNATQATSGNRPIYTTGAINSLPAAAYNGTTNVLSLGTALMAATTTYVALGIKIDTSSLHGAIFGGPSGGELELRVNGTHQELLIENVAVIGTGTTTLTNGSFMTLVATYNSGTGTWALYTCSGGTCTVDSSGTNIKTITAGMSNLGAAPGSSEFYSSNIAEFEYASSITTAGIGAYSLCKFGI